MGNTEKPLILSNSNGGLLWVVDPLMNTQGMNNEVDKYSYIKCSLVSVAAFAVCLSAKKES